MSVSRLGTLCTPVSIERENEEGSNATSDTLFYLTSLLYFLLSFSLRINRSTPSLRTYTPLLSPVLLTSLSAFSLPLSRSLRVIFTSKPLHYLPSLRAIRNGVTLSSRHSHCIITTHPLSWGLLLGAGDIDGEDTEAPVPPQHNYPSPLHTHPRWPLLLTGKLQSKMVCN